jgi:hypothetical protein
MSQNLQGLAIAVARILANKFGRMILRPRGYVACEIKV